MKKWVLFVLLGIVLTTMGGCKKGGWGLAQCSTHVVYPEKVSRIYYLTEHENKEILRESEKESFNLNGSQVQVNTWICTHPVFVCLKKITGNATLIIFHRHCYIKGIDHIHKIEQRLSAKKYLRLKQIYDDIIYVLKTFRTKRNSYLHFRIPWQVKSWIRQNMIKAVVHGVRNCLR